jgi:hypothetical protein
VVTKPVLQPDVEDEMLDEEGEAGEFDINIQEQYLDRRIKGFLVTIRSARVMLRT